MKGIRKPGTSLSGDFAAIILLVALLASTVFTAAEIYGSYRRIEWETRDELRRIEERFVEALAQSIWNLDLLQVSMQLELIGSSELIRAVEVHSDVASLSYHSIALEGATIPPEEVSFPVHYARGSDPIELGTLEVALVAPWEILRRRENLTNDALYEFAKIGLLMAAVYLASSFYLTRPLHRLTVAVDSIDTSNEHSDSGDAAHLEQVRNERNNEIGSLADAFSRMLERTRSEMRARAASQDQLAASLEEKELLLREVHHRVKNNLQLVVSMLALQRRQHEGQAADNVLAAAQNRVYSMSLVHQLLHQEEGLQHLDLREYLATLVREVAGQSNGQVTTSVEGASTHLSADQAIPLGLIVTELLLNSLKHAFPDNRSGSVHVRTALDEESCEVVVADDGVGMRDGAETGGESLGMRLVAALAEQIAAEVVRERPERGTRYTVRFPLQ